MIQNEPVILRFGQLNNLYHEFASNAKSSSEEFRNESRTIQYDESI